MKNITKTEAQQHIAKAATGKADALSLKLFNITEIVKLAAFAAEARRILEEIENVVQFRPEMKEVISDGITESANWLEMEDASSHVLSYVARELEKINTEFTETVYALVRAKTGSTDVDQIGGAA